MYNRIDIQVYRLIINSRFQLHSPSNHQVLSQPSQGIMASHRKPVFFIKCIMHWKFWYLISVLANSYPVASYCSCRARTKIGELMGVKDYCQESWKELYKCFSMPQYTGKWQLHMSLYFRNCCKHTRYFCTFKIVKIAVRFYTE